jgi:hypothetical protein
MRCTIDNPTVHKLQVAAIKTQLQIWFSGPLKKIHGGDAARLTEMRRRRRESVLITKQASHDSVPSAGPTRDIKSQMGFTLLKPEGKIVAQPA